MFVLSLDARPYTRSSRFVYFDEPAVKKKSYGGDSLDHSSVHLTAARTHICLHKSWVLSVA